MGEIFAFVLNRFRRRITSGPVVVPTTIPPNPDPPTVPPSSTGDPQGLSARLLDAQNAERIRAGLPALVFDARLAAAALVQARDCARRDVLTHQGFDGSTSGQRIDRTGYSWSRASENAAQQPKAPPGWPGVDPRTPEWAVSGWMQSPGHRANLLGPYVHAGGAFADAINGTRYWVCDYATPSSSRNAAG